MAAGDLLSVKRYKEKFSSFRQIIRILPSFAPLWGCVDAYSWWAELQTIIIWLHLEVFTPGCILECWAVWRFGPLSEQPLLDMALCKKCCVVPEYLHGLVTNFWPSTSTGVRILPHLLGSQSEEIRGTPKLLSVERRPCARHGMCICICMCIYI